MISSTLRCFLGILCPLSCPVSHINWTISWGSGQSAAEPEELRAALQQIEAIPKDRFEELQHAGQAFAASYLSPVTAAGLRTFWEA